GHLPALGRQPHRVTPLTGSNVQRPPRRQVLQLSHDEPVRLSRPHQLGAGVTPVPFLAVHPGRLSADHSAVKSSARHPAHRRPGPAVRVYPPGYRPASRVLGGGGSAGAGDRLLCAGHTAHHSPSREPSTRAAWPPSFAAMRSAAGTSRSLASAARTAPTAALVLAAVRSGRPAAACSRSSSAAASSRLARS